ncbi:MAG TPA: LuxR C-terminal-related transcriptional regulator [Acidimicrobiales bacterium]|nr:LuxR C-terminal-related transcriptional regulator [Acidimicrobiales bacterium]
MAPSVERARAAFARRAWREALEAFSAVGGRATLDAADLERMAVCAYLAGEDGAAVEAWEGAHRAASEADDVDRSVRCAFWLALVLMLQGRTAQAGGWLARGERVADEAGRDCPGVEYLLIPRFLGVLEVDPTAAGELAARAAGWGRRFHDADLRAFGTLAEGQALIRMGDSVRGTARLDEVMVSVTAGEVGPVTAGIVYCAVILECMQLFDLERAAEWTDALSAWCDAQPDLVPYRGQCLVHRSQLQQAAGRWGDAVATVRAACRQLTEPPHPALGLAHYQEAELHRLVGAFAEAEAEYREASRHGYHPMPGLALLQLARGDGGDAAATIRRALAETAHRLQRPALLAAAVEILRATGDVAGARGAADELATIASTSSSPVLRAMAAQATGAVLVAEGGVAAALVELRAAATAWRSLRMPYEAARAAVLLGLACTALGDRTSAALEFDEARAVFTELGALPDLDRLTTLTRGLVVGGVGVPGAGRRAGLSTREREVLARVAAGETNREIASALTISEHTVGRHLENIFAKLGVTSRAAATAYAYEHDLL